jgi:hypothetical protein
MTTTMSGATRGQILRATLWSLLAAAILLVGVVLPAEYGIDVSGFGRLTGLTRLASSKPGEPGKAAAAPARKAWSIAHADKYRIQTFEVPLKGDEELEYKAEVGSAEPLLYSWHVKEGSKVYFEFHGEPTIGKWPKDYYESYETGEAASAQGSMVAPFTGHHGWYWLNLTHKPVTIVVELAGYYSKFERVGDPPP